MQHAGNNQIQVRVRGRRIVNSGRNTVNFNGSDILSGVSLFGHQSVSALDSCNQTISLCTVVLAYLCAPGKLMKTLQI